MKPVLPFVETMATQVCNLSCVGCTNYSDLTHSGYVPWAVMKDQLSAWLAVIDIPDFGIMGGEPLINPEIRQWLRGVRELMPTSQIRFTTNGLLLDRHLDIVDLAHEIGNVVFKITVHTDSNKLENLIDQIHRRYQWQAVEEYGIQRWATDRQLRFQINRPRQFVKTFRNTYETMQPYASPIDQSFAMCVQQKCPLLYGGRIYKCSTQGLLDSTLARFSYPNFEEWKPYLVNGIAPDSTQEEIKDFIDNFGKPNKICAMCPTAHDSAQIEHRGIPKRKIWQTT